MICDSCSATTDEEEHTCVVLQLFSLKYQAHADLCEACLAKALEALQLEPIIETGPPLAVRNMQRLRRRR